MRISILLFAITTLLPACGGDTTDGPAPGADVGVDQAADAPTWDIVDTADTVADTSSDMAPVDVPDDPLPDTHPDLVCDTPEDVPADTPLDTPPDVPTPCDPNPCPDGVPCHLGPDGPLCTVTGAVVEEFYDADQAAQPTTAAWGDEILTVDLENFGGDGADGALATLYGRTGDGKAGGWSGTSDMTGQDSGPGPRVDCRDARASGTGPVDRGGLSSRERGTR